MAIQMTDGIRQINGEIAGLLLHGSHPLLAYFSSLRIRIADTAPVVLAADPAADADAEAEIGAAGHATESPAGRAWEFDVRFQGESLGSVTAEAWELPDSGSPHTLAEYADRAAQLRLDQNPDYLLPPVQCLLDDHGQILWKNGTFQEIQRLVPEPLENLIQQAFSGQDLLGAAPLDEPKPILAAELTLGQIGMLAIRFPVPTKDGGTLSFVLLTDSATDSKSAVIKEIHHRVKNNLQTIASLLRLQMRRLNSKKVEKAFNESINRISSIALIHEELSRGGIDKINIKSATANIMEMVLSSMVPPGKQITGELGGADIYQDADKASSLSLCITELLQNSVEHAFPMRKKGVIQVEISELDNDAVITIRDNGIGFSGRKAKNSLGLEIIEMITVEKLKGTFTIEGHMDGTVSVIRFPLTIQEKKRVLK